jgi:hypothetical protein
MKLNGKIVQRRHCYGFMRRIKIPCFSIIGEFMYKAMKLNGKIVRESAGVP